VKASISKPWNWAQIPMDEWNDISDEFLPVALRWKALSKKTILDLGCGRGRLSIYLATLGFSVTAVDLSPEGIDQLKKEADRKGLSNRIETLVSDMNELPFADATFDCMLGFHSIYHTTYDNLKVLISKTAKMLLNAGRIFVTFNSKSNQSFKDSTAKKIDDYTIIKSDGIESGIPHTYLDYHDILNLLSDYKILKIQHIQEYPAGRTSFHYFVEAVKISS
jgi:2-polyprenyl-3-methyl-5-hydroxy-6-metoxy-1,4-benzoquinol methylase